MSTYRPRVAYFSPLSPDPSGISQYSELLLPHLAEAWDLVLFVDGYRPEEEFAGTLARFDCHAADPVPHLADFDAVVYHMGNSASHAYVYDTLMAWPGLVVMHELSIHHLLAGRTAAAGRVDLYLEEVRRQYGDAAAERARRAFYDSEDGLWEAAPLEYPLHRRVLDQATGILCHSRFVRDAVRAMHPKLHVSVVDHPAWISSMPEARPVADGPARLRLVAAGNLTTNKAIDHVIRACGALRERFDLELRLVGRVEVEFDVGILAAVEGLADRLTVLGRVDDGVLMAELDAADLCFCVRAPTLGETSGVALRALSVGTPVVVSDDGWFSELPDSIAWKVSMPQDVHGSLEESLAPLLADPERRASMSVAARDWAAARTPARTAAGYVRWVREAGAFPRIFTGRAFGLLAEHARNLGLGDAAALALPRGDRFEEIVQWRPAPRTGWRSAPDHLAPGSLTRPDWHAPDADRAAAREGDGE